MRQRIYLLILTILVILSLGLNLFLVREALILRRQLSVGATTTVEALDVAIEQLDEVRTASFTVQIPVEEQVRVQTNIDLQEEFQVPINTTIPIETDVRVPIEVGPFGTYNITVPIETEVPVSLTVPIEIDRRVPVSATVPIDLVVPIEVNVADTPLAEQLVVWRRALIRVRDQIFETMALPTVAPTSDPSE